MICFTQAMNYLSEVIPDFIQRKQLNHALVIIVTVNGRLDVAKKI
jgi:transcriptional regulator